MSLGFGRTFALVLTAAWFAAILAAVFYCAFEPQAQLKYLTL
jgi:hypothetical protein